MKSLIDVFRMEELPAKTRARVIIALGRAINNRYGMVITDELVYELLLILDPENPEIDELKTFLKKRL